MPTFLEYLLAPWKVFTVLLSGPPNVSVSGASNGAPPGSLCYLQKAGDQVLSVCRVGAYEMPSFVFWASLLIFTLFLISSLSLFFQCLKLSHALSSIASKLSRMQAGNKGLSEEQLAVIRDAMEKEQVVSRPWKEFEETLLISGKGDEVYSTSSIETFFSRAAIIEDNIHTALYNAIPGVLTGLGLLMTFVAILDGLSHVSVDANMDVKGIAGLINGLSGKFVSSIVAVTCAVLFVFVERLAYSRPQESYRELLRQISKRFKRRTTEHLLFGIQTQLLAQAQILSQLQGAPKRKEV